MDYNDKVAVTYLGSTRLHHQREAPFQEKKAGLMLRVAVCLAKCPNCWKCKCVSLDVATSQAVGRDGSLSKNLDRQGYWSSQQHTLDSASLAQA